jgi:hypothetical protein
MSALPVAAPWSPACMDDDERTAWEAKNARVTGMFGGVGKADRPCTDCTLGFAADMRAIGRCNGAPGGVEEEETMDQDRTVTRIESAATTKVAIALAAPCGGCGHAPVCRLRESVEALARTTVSVPKLEPGLAVELRGTIACEWFVKAKGAQPTAPRPKRELSPEQREAARERMLHARAIGVARKAEAAGVQ